MKMLNNTNNTNNSTRTIARLTGLCIAAALHAITPSTLAQPAVQALLPGYKKLETRQATREAALAKLGGNAVEWGRWMAVGPLGHPKGGKDIATAYEPEDLLAAMKEDKEVSLEREFKGKGGMAIAFTEVSPDHFLKTGDPSAIDLEKFAGGPQEKAVAYLYRRAVVDRAIDVPIAMGSDDGVRLWLNGELVVDVNAERPMSPDSERATLRLRKGINHLLFKVSQGAGEWTLAFSQGFEMRPQVEAALDFALDRDFPSAEQTYYKLSTVPAVTRGVDGRDLPIVAEVGGIDMYPPARQGGKQRVILTTRRGEAWLVDGVFANPPLDPKWTLFAGGLQEPLGAAVRPAQGREGVDVFCAQRGELTRLADTNGDGVADVFDTLCAAWQISGNYHEYAFGPKFDRAGNAWVTLNLAHTGGDGTVMGAPDPHPRLGRASIDTAGTLSTAPPTASAPPTAIGIYLRRRRCSTPTTRATTSPPASSRRSEDGLASTGTRRQPQAYREGYGPNWKHGRQDRPPRSTMPQRSGSPTTKMGQSASDVLLDDDERRKFGPFAGPALRRRPDPRHPHARLTSQKLTERARRPRSTRAPASPSAAAWPPACTAWCSRRRRKSMFVGMTDRGWGSVGAEALRPAAARVVGRHAVRGAAHDADGGRFRVRVHA
jgi:hypothetical protein